MMYGKAVALESVLIVGGEDRRPRQLQLWLTSSQEVHYFLLLIGLKYNRVLIVFGLKRLTL